MACAVFRARRKISPVGDLVDFHDGTVDIVVQISPELSDPVDFREDLLIGGAEL